jgi:hypothetical protein
MIKLFEITSENIETIKNLDSGTNFLPSNSYSLNDFLTFDKSGCFVGDFIPFIQIGIGLLDDGTIIPIGFAAVCIDSGFLRLKRFMIDKKYQSKGYGTHALYLVIDKSFEIFPDCDKIYVSSGNEIAHKLYLKRYFEMTGEIKKCDTPYGIIIEHEFVLLKSRWIMSKVD